MTTSFRVSSMVLALGIFTAGCAVESTHPDTSDSTSDALSNSKIKLPAGDTCRDVLAPLALGLADSSYGLDYANAVTVSLTSETDTRLYTVSVAKGGNAVKFDVELDNDSASMCLLLSVKSNNDATLENDKRTAVTSSERNVNAKFSITPKNDDCAPVVKLLAQAAGISAVGEKNIQQVSASLESETEDRDYSIHVDGKSFQANGKTFDNDYDFSLNVSNDSAFKCFVQEFAIK